MFGKGSKLYSIGKMKCPRCQESDVFKTKNPYNKMTAINENCSHCGLRYEKEPGFFYGSMYVSYMISVAFFVTLLVAYFVVLEQYISGWVLMAIYLGITLLMVPISYRLSRIVWLNFFNSYDPEKRGTK